jgi:hypothetical protein
MPRVHQGRDSRKTRNEVVSEKQHAFLRARHGQHHDSADCREHSNARNGGALAFEARGAPTRADDADDLDGAEGYVEENGLEIGVAKVSDDEVAEGGYATTSDTKVRQDLAVSECGRQ